MSPKNNRIVNTLNSRIDKNAQSATKKSILGQLKTMLESPPKAVRLLDNMLDAERVESPRDDNEYGAWGTDLLNDEILKSVEVGAIRDVLLTIKLLRQHSGIDLDKLYSQVEKEKKGFEEESPRLKTSMPEVHDSFVSLSKGVGLLAREVAEIKVVQKSIIDENLAKRIESIEKTQEKIYSELKNLAQLVPERAKSRTPKSRRASKSPNLLTLTPDHTRALQATKPQDLSTSTQGNSNSVTLESPDLTILENTNNDSGTLKSMPDLGTLIQQKNGPQVENVKSSLASLTPSATQDQLLPKSDNTNPPFIMLKTIRTVADAYTEWYEGIDGQPSVVEFDAIYGTRWHRQTSGDNSRYYNRRKLITEIDWAISQGLPPNAAVEATQALIGTVYPSLESLQAGLRRAEQAGSHILSDAVEQFLQSKDTNPTPYVPSAEICDKLKRLFPHTK